MMICASLLSVVFSSTCRCFAHSIIVFVKVPLMYFGTSLGTVYSRLLTTPQPLLYSNVTNSVIYVLRYETFDQGTIRLTAASGPGSASGAGAGLVTRYCPETADTFA